MPIASLTKSFTAVAVMMLVEQRAIELDAPVHDRLPELALSDPRGARITYLEIVGVSMELERHRREVLRGFATLVEGEADALARAGEIPARDHHLTALALGGAVDGLLTDCFTNPQPPSVEAIVATLVDLFLAAFL
jgi:hypothetical protein